MKLDSKFTVRINETMGKWLKAEATQRKMTTAGVVRLILNDALRSRHNGGSNHIS